MSMLRLLPSQMERMNTWTDKRNRNNGFGFRGRLVAFHHKFSMIRTSYRRLPQVKLISMS